MDRINRPNEELKKFNDTNVVKRHLASNGDCNGRPDRVHSNVQRSKSDARHETRAAFLQQQSIRRGSNFELAFLLERGRTLDAKLFGEREWKDNCEISKLDRRSFDEISSNIATENGRQNVFLPFRLKQALAKRRFSSSACGRFFPPRTPLSSSLQGSAITVSSPLDSLPELGIIENPCQIKVDLVASDQRIKDIEETILWLRQEILSLKQQDRNLFRQLLSLGTDIHKMSGMESCQSYSASLDMDDIADIQRDDHSSIKETLIDRNYIDESASDNFPMKNSEITSLKDNKLIDICTSYESFF